MSRIDEPGWVLLGMRDASGRRGVWVRVAFAPSAMPGLMVPSGPVELCYGREGDDSHLVFAPDSPAYSAMLDLALFAIYVNDCHAKGVE